MADFQTKAKRSFRRATTFSKSHLSRRNENARGGKSLGERVDHDKWARVAELDRRRMEAVEALSAGPLKEPVEVEDDAGSVAITSAHAVDLIAAGVTFATCGGRFTFASYGAEPRDGYDDAWFFGFFSISSFDEEGEDDRDGDDVPFWMNVLPQRCTLSQFVYAG